MKILVMVFSVVMASGQPAEKLLESARHKEVMGGDLKGAIAEYRKIAERFAKQPEVAAQALLRMGECQEKLGEAEARKSYERVVKEYSGAGLFVTQARARLAAMGGGKVAGVRTQMLWDKADLVGSVSQDGRLLSLNERMSGDLAVRDLVSGETITVKRAPKGNDRPGLIDTNRISPDGKRVAFVWNTWDKEAVQNNAATQLRLIGTDGTGEKTLFSVPGYIWVLGWSDDGKKIAATVMLEDRRDATQELMIFTAETGARQILKTPGKKYKNNARFSPDGKWVAFDEIADGDRTPVVYVARLDDEGVVAGELVRDAKIMGWSPDGSGILFAREREGRSSLHLQPVVNGKASGVSQPLYAASNIGRPLGLTSGNKLIYALTTEQRDGLLVGFDADSGRVGQAVTQFTADKAQHNMRDAGIKLSPDGRSVVWVEEPNRIHVRSIEGDRHFSVKVQVEEIRRVEWAPDGSSLWVGGRGMDDKKGLYRVDPASGAATFVMGPLGFDGDGYAITFAMSRDGKTVFYRNLAGKLLAHELGSGVERVLLEDFTRVPNLSVSHDGKKLAIRTGGNLGVLDLVTGQMKWLYRRNFETDHNVMYGLDWSADDSKLVVIARNFQTELSASWIFPVDGGNRIEAAQPFTISGINLLPDGKTAAVLKIEYQRQVWALENFLPAKK